MNMPTVLSKAKLWLTLRNCFNFLMESRFSVSVKCEDADKVIDELKGELHRQLEKFEPASLESDGRVLQFSGPYRALDRKLFKLWYGLDTWSGPPNISAISSARIAIEGHHSCVQVEVRVCFGARLFLDAIPFLLGATFVLVATMWSPGLPVLAGLSSYLIPLVLLLLSRLVATHRLRHVLVRSAEKFANTVD